MTTARCTTSKVQRRIGRPGSTGSNTEGRTSTPISRSSRTNALRNYCIPSWSTCRRSLNGTWKSRGMAKTTPSLRITHAQPSTISCPIRSTSNSSTRSRTWRAGRKSCTPISCKIFIASSGRSWFNNLLNFGKRSCTNSLNDFTSPRTGLTKTWPANCLK